MRLAVFLGLMVGLVSPARAQTFGACETGRAQRFLENDQLRVAVFNTGTLFFGGETTSGDGYLIPKQDRTKSPLSAVSFWLGGLVDGELRVAAARYGVYNFWPGPLKDAAHPPQDCSEYDRIFVVSRDDIQRYYETGELTDDLRDWPHQLGAPVLDGDGDPTNYDLQAGDQPDLIGDQAAWWVMNDAGNEHPATGSTAPLGVEVRVQAFVYGYTAATASPVLAQTSFYRYEVINRSQKTIDSTYVTMWSDSDLGGAGDDHMGTDTLRNMVFVYNADNEDSSYGVAPPAQGIQVLQGPVGLANGRDDDRDGQVDELGEEVRATSSGHLINAGPDGTDVPGSRERYYNLMRGLWPDGSPYYEMGAGWRQPGASATRFSYPGDPVAQSFWSEVNNDGEGGRSYSGQRKMVVSTGPFRLAPGASVTLLYAMPFGQGSDHLNSVAVMRGYASTLQSLAAQGFFTSSPVEVARPDPTFELALTRPRPNPSRQPEVMLTLPADAHVRAEVYDLLGRQLDVIVDGELAEGETVLAMPDGLAPGTYVLRVQVAHTTEQTLPFTLVR